MRKKNVVMKSVTKGRFHANFTTNAGQWINDRKWKQMANQDAYKATERYEK